MSRSGPDPAPVPVSRRDEAPPAWMSHRVFIQRVALAVGIGGLAIGVALILWLQIRFLLLSFAGLLLAVVLYRLSKMVVQWTRVPYWTGLTLTCMVLVAVTIGTFWLMGERIAVQVEVLREQIPEAWERVRAVLERQTWGRWVLEQARLETAAVQERPLLAPGIDFLSMVGELAAEVLVVVFVALFGAISPQLYVRGLVRLVPMGKRGRAHEVLCAIGDLLWWWLIGQLVAMGFIGVVTTVAVWLLGMPLSLTLGIIAAILNFIPNFGPILAAIPALMVALLEGPWTALYVALVYAGIQLLQNHLVTPVVQQQAVDLPPVILLLAQVFMYYWGGLLGMALAPPIAAIVLKVVQMLYVRDVLGDPMEDHEHFWPEESGGGGRI